jgi:hypothetical protein
MNQLEGLTNYQKHKEAIYRWRHENPQKNYQSNKPHIYNWILINPDKHRDQSRLSMRRCRAKAKLQKEWEQIRFIYFNILL